jgi:hypothetical protein
MVEIDDFPYVWQVFEDDDILQKMGKPRVFSKPDLYFTGDWVWDFFIRKVNLAFAKCLARDPDHGEKHTTLVEFARGGDDGIAHALSELSDDILKRAALLYIKVSYEESVRKNRRRARPGQEDSILYHSLPDAKMEYYYKTNDWEKLSNGRDEGAITVKGHTIPFAVLRNEPEVTDTPEHLAAPLAETLDRLWKLWKAGA